MSAPAVRFPSRLWAERPDEWVAYREWGLI